MAVIASAVETSFTPASGPFIAQCTGPGMAVLWRKGQASLDWAVAEILPQNRSVDVPNPVAGAVYQFTAEPGVVVAACQ